MGTTRYLFRGDDAYQGGPVGLKFGNQADSADIQNLADHVLRKATKRTSRFASTPDNRFVRKVELRRLRELEKSGLVRIWDPQQVFEVLQQLPRRFANQAFDVRTAMQRNREVLIEGQIPAALLQVTK